MDCALCTLLGPVTSVLADDGTLHTCLMCLQIRLQGFPQQENMASWQVQCGTAPCTLARIEDCRHSRVTARLRSSASQHL